ncbi:nuclear pore complex assembly-domain-containing protein [Lanmaoa asiatica]|nr:nuclear pore complex assembly-domain-containing protein [Lanmaoa asiatica]
MHISQDFDCAAVASNVDDWLARFSPVAGSKPSAFPFTSHKIQSIESRRARMSDLLIFDVLLIRGGIRSPDVLFPPADWEALNKLLDEIDESVYDTLKKDCLVYILLKWAWDIDPKEANSGWDARYLQDRCIAPQFAALADAYWLLDTGTHLAKAVSVLSDARLNRDYVSKILQALALSSSPASFASGTASATAALVVKYVRTAKPLLTEPDDIDLYAISLAQLSFMDAWAYQMSFPEGSDTRERLLRKIVGWCLMPMPKHEPLVQLLAFPLSSYEQSSLHALALPFQFSTTSSLSSVNTHATPSGPVLSSQAISILQDLLCVRAIQSGDYVRAIKLDRQFSSVSPPLAGGASSSSIASQATSSGRGTIDRKSIIQDLFATLPPAERTLLEDEMGKVATGVRPNASSTLTLRQGTSVVRRSLTAELSLSASWEEVGAGTGSPVPASVSSSAVGAGFTGKATPASVSAISKINQSPFLTSTSMSPFAARVPRPQPASVHRAPPTPKITAFGSPMPPTTGVSTSRGVITERGKTLFSTSAAGGPSAAVKPATHVSLFDTAGSAKNAPNAFYRPPSAPAARASLDVGSVLVSSSIAKSAELATNTAQQNGKAQGGESDGEDVSMGSRSDVEIIEEGRRDASGGEEQDEEAATDEDEDDAENFITYDKSGVADLTLHPRDIEEVTGENHGVGLDLGFSVFNGSRSAVQNDSAGGKRRVSGNGHARYASPPLRARVSPSREGDKSLSMSVNSTTTSRRHALPGAFHDEEEDDEDRHYQHENEDGDNEDDNRASPTTPINSPRRSTRTRMQAQTPSGPSARSQPQRSLKNTTTTTSGASRLSRRGGRTPSKPSLSQSIPGSLVDEDHNEHGQDDADQTDTRGDEDTEMDEQEEEDDAIAPLPSRSSRRTRSSGSFGASTTTSTKSKSRAKSTAPASTSATATAAKSKPKARPSEVRTPARRSSRLSTASSASPDHTEVASPTKKGRRSTGSKASIAGSGSGTVATRSSARRKR